MESLIARIQKLLALGERGGTEAEAEAAMQKAHELLAKHNLSLDDVKGVEAEEDYVMDESAATARQPWQDYIYGSVSRLYFCRHLKRTRYCGSKVSGVQHLIIGKPSNVAVVKYIAAYLIRTGGELAREAAAGAESRQAFVNSFKKGFAIRINSRVNEEIKKAREGKMTDASTGTALVLSPLYDRANNEIDGFLLRNSVRPKASKSTASGPSDYAGYAAGRAAAESMSLTSNAVAGQGRKAISA